MITRASAESRTCPTVSTAEARNSRYRGGDKLGPIRRLQLPPGGYVKHDPPGNLEMNGGTVGGPQRPVPVHPVEAPA